MKDQSDDPSHHEWMLLPRSYISLPGGRETIFSCPHTFKFQTHLLTGTTSGMASDCPWLGESLMGAIWKLSPSGGYGSLLIFKVSGKRIYGIVNLTQLVWRMILNGLFGNSFDNTLTIYLSPEGYWQEKGCTAYHQSAQQGNSQGTLIVLEFGHNLNTLPTVK